MELAIDDPIKRAQQYAINPNNYQGGQAPLSSNPSVSQEMGSMIKQRAMNTALNKGQEGIMNAITPAVTSTGAANTAALAANPATMGMGGAEVALAGQTMGGAGAGAGMAALGTAMPYVGAGLLAGKALGFFNEGGTVGPLSAQYIAQGGMPEGYNYKRPRYSPSQGIDEASLRAMQDKKDFEDALAWRDYQLVMEMGSLNPTDADVINEGYFHRNYKSQGGPISYNAQGTMSEEQAMALMNNQPEPTPMPTPRPNPYDLLLDREMSMPTPRPQMEDYGADRTSSPYDMLRSDNAPNT